MEVRPDVPDFLRGFAERELGVVGARLDCEAIVVALTPPVRVLLVRRCDEHSQTSSSHCRAGLNHYY